MNCGNWEERIALYAGGEADAVETAAVEAHLGDCPACRKWSDELRSSMNSLRDLHGEPVEEAHFAAVRARVLAEIGGEASAWWRRGWVYGLVALAAAAIIAGVVTRPAPRVQPKAAAVHEVTPPAPVIIEAPAKIVVAPRPRKVTRPRVQVAMAKEEIPPPTVSPEPLVVKLLTDDPDVVIYWIADGTGDRQ